MIEKIIKMFFIKEEKRNKQKRVTVVRQCKNNDLEISRNPKTVFVSCNSNNETCLSKYFEKYCANPLTST